MGKNQYALLGIVGFIAGFAAGCGKTNDLLSSDNQSAAYTYSYSVNGCETGSHTFNSKADFCAGLLNEVLNRYCAYSIRIYRYDQECR